MSLARQASSGPSSTSSSVPAPPLPPPQPEQPAASRAPGRLVELTGDLVQAALNKEITYIAHQTNCVTVSARGLAENIFATFPSADIYKERKEPDKAGTIVIRGKVINMLAQVYPGPPTVSESEAMRLHWFRACLEKMKEELDPVTTKSVAFPYRIGCGLAKGYWPHYHQALKKFAEAVSFYIYVIKPPDTAGVSAGTRARTGKRVAAGDSRRGGGRGGGGGGGGGGLGGEGAGRRGRGNGKPAVNHE